MKQLPPWSFSMIEAFGNCPRAAFHKYILKEKSPETEAQAKGNRLDKALEDRIKNNTPLPDEFAMCEKMVAPVASRRSHETKLSTQLKMGLDREFVPCGFFAEQVWGRGVLDVLLVNKPKATIIDWKSGKNNEGKSYYDGGLQRKIFALLVFKHFPLVDELTAVNIYLLSGEIGKPLVFKREQQAPLWREVLPKIMAMEKAFKEMEWPCVSGPLCSYCPVKACQYNRS